MRGIAVVVTFAAALAWSASAEAQGTCSHDECEIGDPLTEDCSVCAEAVCGSDAYCCEEEWDDKCVELADFLCNWCGGDGTSDTGGDDHDGGESSGDDGADGNDDDAQDDSPGPGDDDDDDNQSDDDDDDDDDDDGSGGDDQDRGKNDMNDGGGPVAPVARGGDAQGCSIGSGQDRGLALIGLVLWFGVRRRLLRERH